MNDSCKEVYALETDNMWRERWDVCEKLQNAGYGREVLKYHRADRWSFYMSCGNFVFNNYEIDKFRASDNDVVVISVYQWS